jgi:hypothetical protein
MLEPPTNLLTAGKVVNRHTAYIDSLFRIPKRVSTWDTRHGASSLASNRLVPTRMLVVWGREGKPSWLSDLGGT